MEQSLKDLLTEMVEFSQQDQDYGYNIRTDYSGRAMYGKTCVGVSGDNPMPFIIECMKNFMDMGDTDYASDFFELLQHHKTDSMGCGTIVYFPRWVIETEEDKEFVAELFESEGDEDE